MSYCGEQSKVKVAPDHWDVATLKCRAWTCELCQPRRRAQLIAEAIRGRPDTFITLTLDGSWAGRAAEGVAALARAWRLIRKRHARLMNGETVPFLAVVEKTERGIPHLHILARSKWIDQRWLSAAMLDITGSFIVDIRRIRHASQIVGYCAKYVGKDPQKIGTAKRYWRSQNYIVDERPPLPPLPPGHYYDKPWKIDIHRLAAQLSAMGHAVTWHGPDRVVIQKAHDPPTGPFVFPGLHPTRGAQ